MMSKSHTKKLLIAIILTVTLHELTNLFTLANEIVKNKNNLSISSQVRNVLRLIVKKCFTNKDQYQLHRNNNAVIILKDCLKRRGVHALDRALSRDVIEITDNVVFVKRKNYSELEKNESNFLLSKSAKYFSNLNLELMEKLARFLKTRVLQISFKRANVSVSESQGRGRNKNNQFGQMLTFGLVAAGLIVIPLGFQFLAVLGGKALLLAKLSLLLTSIQGLKKIATSHVNYGLYSTGHGGPCKDSVFDWGDGWDWLISDKGYGEGNSIDDDRVPFDIHFHDHEWHYDRQWHYDPEQYSSKFHPSSLSAPFVDYPLQRPPVYNTLQHSPVDEHAGI